MQTRTRVALLLGGSLLVHGMHAHAASERPSAWAACIAWERHVQDLLELHRRASEISDDEFGAAMRLFYEARSACSSGRFEEGLAAYHAFPVGRPKDLALR